MSLSADIDHATPPDAANFDLSGNGIESKATIPKALVVFRAETIAEDERFKEHDFSEYFTDVIGKLEAAKLAKAVLANGTITSADKQAELEKQAQYNPQPNAADVLLQVMTKNYPPSKLPSGYMEYPFFTAGIGGLNLHGNLYAKEQIVRFIAAQAAGTPEGQKMLLLVAPTSAGKSTLTKLLRVGLEEYGRQEEPIYAIAGCPTHENPLHALGPETRATISEEYGVKIEGELCAHCQAIPKNELKVQAIHYSGAGRVGIGKIEPKDTLPDGLEGQDAISKKILGSSGGMLEIAELFLHNDEFVSTLYELIRERTREHNGAEYGIDTVMISHGTLQRYKKFAAGNPDAAFRQRVEVVYLTYPLSIDDEVAIYKDKIEKSRLHPHLSPQVLETLAKVGVVSRLVESKIPGVTPEVKMKIYNGEETEKIRQSDRRRIEQEGRDNAVSEGLDLGFSPQEMLDLLSVALVENDKCLSPLRAMAAAARYVRQRPEALFGEKETMLHNIDVFFSQYEEWLEKTIKHAFRGDFEKALQDEFAAYLTEVSMFTNKEKQTDPITEDEVEPDEQRMRAIEETWGISENAKKDHREHIAMQQGAKYRRGGNLTIDDIPGARAIFEKKITGLSEQDMEKLLVKLLGRPAPDTNEQKTLNEVRNRLTDPEQNYGFCPHCADELMKHTARKIDARGVKTN